MHRSSYHQVVIVKNEHDRGGDCVQIVQQGRQHDLRRVGTHR